VVAPISHATLSTSWVTIQGLIRVEWPRVLVMVLVPVGLLDLVDTYDRVSHLLTAHILATTFSFALHISEYQKD